MLIHVAGPHEALVKSMRGRQPQIVIGGRCLVIPTLQTLNRLSLHLRTLIVTSSGAVTLNRISMHVVSCCQVKFRAWIPGDDGSTKVDMPALRLAAQHFIDKSDPQIDSAIKNTMEGHQRAIVATLSVEDLYRNRAKFVATVRQVAEEDLAGMGVALVSYTVQTISDETGYMLSLGETPVASVKRTAEQATAEFEGRADAYVAERGAEMQEAKDAQRERILRSNGARTVRREDAQREINQAEGIANAAYGIEVARQDQTLLQARQQAVAARQREGNIIEEVFVEREQLRNEATRNVESDAQLYLRRVQAQADMVVAQAQAEKIRVIGKARGETRDVVADVESEFMERRIEIFNKCENDAFFQAEIIDKLPELVRAQNVIAPATTMTFVSGGSAAVVPGENGAQGDGISELRAGSDVDNEIDITRAISTASRSVPGRAAAGLLALRVLRNRFWPSCFGRRQT